MAAGIQSDFNVAINFDDSSNSFQAYRGMCGPLTGMKSFIEGITSEDLLKKIIQKFLRAAEYVHDTTGVHGNIEINSHFVANPDILIQSTAVFRNFKNKPGKPNNISSVYEVCERIFRETSNVKKSDSNTENHFRQLMEEEQPIKNILRHPFFWDDEKKLAFICSVAQFVKRSTTDLQDNVRKKLHNLKYQDWINDLDITDLEERDQYEKIYGGKIASDAIQSLANNRTYATYDKNLSCLLNFIRNHHEHFWEQHKHVQACFGEDKTCGYLNFFIAHRFKNLLCDVYDVVNSFEQNRLLEIL